MTLKARLLLAAVYVLTVVTIGLEVPLALNVSRQALRQEEKSVLTYAALLAARINDDLPGAAANPERASEPRRAIAILARITGDKTRIRYVVVDGHHRVIADSDGIETVGALFENGRGPGLGTVFGQPGGEIDVREPPGTNQLVVTVPVVHFRAAIGAVQASEPLTVVRANVHRTWLGYAAVGLVAILVGLAATWILAGTLVRPVRRLQEAAVRLGAGDLEARAEPTGPVEVATLATKFNQMATALSANLAAQKDFLANASHQLRTPLTGLRLRLEAIQEEGGAAAEQASKAAAEVDRLAELVEDLLSLARASSAEAAGTPVDLGERCRDAIDRWAATAAREGKSVIMLDGAPATAWADTGDVDHVLDNLIENAIRYTPNGTEVSVASGVRDGAAFVSVRDDGPGIPAEDRGRVFERFYRGANGRKSGPGTGLGLAVARELARRWGGDLRLAGGDGAAFEVMLPSAAGQAATTRSEGPVRPAVS